MDYHTMFKMVTSIYAKLIRPLLVKEVQGTDTKWDDVLLDLVDEIFEYKK